MKKILGMKKYRNNFLLLITLLILLLILTRYIISNDIEISKFLLDTATAISDGLIVSLFTTVAIGLFIFWITPKIIKKSHMDIVYPKEINLLLRQAVNDTKLWIYKGATGRYTRNVTMPFMVKYAKNESLPRHIKICLLDPMNTNVCQQYSKYRRSLKSTEKKKELWQENKVIEQIVATAISAILLKINEPIIDIELYFTNYFSTFRFDISDKYIIITKEDPEATALRADSETYFYDSYKYDFKILEEQCRKVDFDTIEHDSNLPLSLETVELILNESKILKPEQIKNLNIKNVLSLLEGKDDPYK